MKKLLLILFLRVNAFAAIAFDATSNSASTSPVAGVVAFSASVNSSNNNILVVCAVSRGDTIASVLWNGVSLTKAVDLFPSADLYASLWYKTGAETGTHNVAIATVGTGPAYLAGTAVSMTGVLQTSPLDDTDAVSTAGANPVFTAFTTTVDGAAVIDCVASNDNLAITMNIESGRDERSNFFALDNVRGTGTSTIIPKSPAGSVVMGWDVGSNNSSYVGADFKPAANGIVPQNFRILGGKMIIQ